MFEEIVGGNPDYASGIGSVQSSTDAALEGARSLRVWANEAGSVFSNHVIAQHQVSTHGQRGSWRYEFHFRIGPTVGETGPEFSIQNTRETAPGAFRTATAGLQYQSNPWLPAPGTWAIWVEQAPGVAAWEPLVVEPLSPETWYFAAMEVDYDANRYLRFELAGPDIDLDIDLEDRVIALEPKWNEEAFWVTLEAENLWSGASAAHEHRVYYDAVVLTARTPAPGP